MRKPKNFPVLPGTTELSPVFGTETESFSLADVFGEHFEGPVLEREIVIESEQIRKLIKKDYLYISKMLHTVTRAREYQRADQGKLNQLEENLEQAIKAVQQLLSDRTIKLQALFNKHPDAKYSVRAARRTKFIAPVASPHAFGYLDMLEEADVFFSRAHSAWIQKVTKPQEHNDLVREIKRLMYGIKHHITKARIECFNLMEKLQRTMDKTDPDAAQLTADLTNSAKSLIADAQADSEVRESLSLSEGRELERATGESLESHKDKSQDSSSLQADGAAIASGDGVNPPAAVEPSADAAAPKPSKRAAKPALPEAAPETITPA